MKGQFMSASVSYFGLFNFHYSFSSGCVVQDVQGSGLLLWGDVHSTGEAAVGQPLLPRPAWLMKQLPQGAIPHP